VGTRLPVFKRFQLGQRFLDNPKNWTQKCGENFFDS